MNKPIPMHTPRHRRHSHGFTILEMSVVLVIIALIIGIFASMFTAITVSRALAVLIYGGRKKLASVAI